MKVLLLVVLFNIHTGQVGDYTVVKIYPGGDIARCEKDLISIGPKKPDKGGDVPLFECAVEGSKPTVHLIGM